jgi:ABC-type multidrug transport system fused ATPase/permease subunit
VELFAVLGLFVLIATALFTQHQAIGFLTIGAFLTAAYKIMPGVVKILNTSGQMKIYAYTATDLLQAATPTTPAETMAANDILQSIAFSQVGFGYADKKILHNCSFSLQSGDFAGLQGSSGQGKTTLLNLLLGFADCDSGSICINDKATTGPERQPYLAQMAYVKQQPFMLHDTIHNNITLSDGQADAAKLQAAIEASGLQPLIAALPDGLHTVVTENGKNISGGQRQRIAFARALYKDASLLLLDEPFSELDEAAETALLQHCKKLAAQGKIVLLITHNPQGLAFCNKTISLHETT